MWKKRMGSIGGCLLFIVMFSGIAWSGTIYSDDLEASEAYFENTIVTDRPQNETAGWGITDLIKAGGTFSISDLQGTWYMYDASSYSIVNMDTLGNVISGANYHADGTRTVASGSFTLAADGTGSGSSTYTDDSSSNYPFIKMDNTKNNAIVGVNDTYGNSVTVAVKAGGVFTTADLAGVWYFFGTIEDIQLGFTGNFTVDTSGNVTTGSFTGTDGTTRNITGGLLSVDASGVMSGNITDSSGDTITAVHGKMSASKTLFISVFEETTTSTRRYIQGELYGGTYATSDSGGNWYGIGGENGGNLGYGMVTVANDGTITGGTITDLVTGSTLDITGGTVVISVDGELSGNVQNGQVILRGRMDQGKNVMGQIFTLGGGTIKYDFNGDGKADILYRHPSLGKVGAWLMDGTTEDTWAYIANQGTAWDIKAVGDMNQDTSMDIVYRHTSGNIGVWLMNGTTETTWQLIGNHGTGWDIKGAGDFDNNGKSDLLYRHTNGNIGVWLMDGTSEATWHLIGNHGTSWDVNGVADFNRDGYADVLYRHNDGRVGVWVMNGTTESTWHLISNHGSAWTPECLSDYNADNDIDIIYRHTGGNVGVWLMDGLTENTWHLIGNHGTWDIR